MLDEKLIRAEFERIFTRSEPHGISHRSGGVDEMAISDAEVEVKLTFPRSYRLYLKQFGAATYDCCNIHGIFSEEAFEEYPWWGVVDRTEWLRMSGLLSVVPPHQRCPPIDRAIHLAASDLLGNLSPDQVVSVAADDDGVNYYLDYTHFVDGEPPVVAISGYFGPSVAATSFLEFLRILVRSEGAPNPFNLYIQ